MPLFEYECPKCKEKTEVLVKSAEAKPTCKKCGSELARVYSGKMFGSTGKKSGACSGNCSTCGGCK